MTRWLRRIRGAVGMGLIWAAGWALGGVLIEVASRLLPGFLWGFFEVFDAPSPALAIPGFVGGVLFSAVLGIAARRRRFDELSLPRFTALGAVGGLLLSLVPAAMVAVGLASVDPDVGLWRITAVISGPLTFLSVVSASGSLLLARMAEDRGSLGPARTCRRWGVPTERRRSCPEAGPDRSRVGSIWRATPRMPWHSHRAKPRSTVSASTLLSSGPSPP